LAMSDTMDHDCAAQRRLRSTEFKCIRRSRDANYD
jgi:hypothetical protein